MMEIAEMNKDDGTALELINLPDIVLETILSNLTYDEIAKYRIVCKTFDNICKKLLNRGFNLMKKYHEQCLKAIKCQLPRRESKRRNHPLAHHCNILSAIETRISMLSMTFTKYVDLNLCCFIPGKVIDEIFRVLRLVRNSKTSRTPEILQELRDISSMAIEYFDEKILPNFKHSICTSLVTNESSYKCLTLPDNSQHVKKLPLLQIYSPDRLNMTFRRIYNRTKRNKMRVMSLKGHIGKMRLQIRLQSLKLQESAKKIQSQNAQLREMKKQFEEWEQKLGDVTAELSRAREETHKSDSLEDCKRKESETSNSSEPSLLNTKELQAKKRKLIVERKSSSDAQEVKFKKFMTELLSDSSIEEVSY